MSSTSQSNIAESRLRAVHAVISRALAVAAEQGDAFARSGYPDAARAEGFILYVHTLGTVMHAHHLTEDDLCFPYFRDKLPDMPIDRLIADHQKMEPLIADLRAASSDDPAKIAATAAQLAGIWRSHIAVEDRHWSLEQLAKVVGPEESVRIHSLFAAHHRQHAQPDHLVIPFTLFNLPPERRAIFTDQMDPDVMEQLVPVEWKDKWAPMIPFLLE
jgi:hemerythrin-like domain-containing protein